MRDPVTVIENICRITDRCYIWIWSHVYDEAIYSGPPIRNPATELWHVDYGRSPNMPKFRGGNGAYARWLRANDMLSLFERHGLKPFDVVPPIPRASSQRSAFE